MARNLSSHYNKCIPEGCLDSLFYIKENTDAYSVIATYYYNHMAFLSALLLHAMSKQTLQHSAEQHCIMQYRIKQNLTMFIIRKDKQKPLTSYSEYFVYKHSLKYHFFSYSLVSKVISMLTFLLIVYSILKESSFESSVSVFQLK